MIDRFCAEGHGQLYDPVGLQMGDRLEPYSGFYSRYNDRYYSHAASKRLLTRVEINRRRATSEEQILYSTEVLNESQPHQNHPMYYRGRVLLEDERLAQSLYEFLENHRDALRLGGSTSRGLGKIKIHAIPPQTVKNRVIDRIALLNQTLRQRWQKWSNVFPALSNGYNETRTYFTLDLQSDAALTDNWRATTVISESMLKAMVGIEDESLILHSAYSSYDYRAGWNSAWGLMKDIEIVTQRGAVYLFSVASCDRWQTALAALENTGVGDRTGEGFGQIQVCNEFHLVFRENAV